MGCGCLVLPDAGWSIKDHRHTYCDMVVFSFLSLLLLFHGVTGGQNMLYKNKGWILNRVSLLQANRR